MDAPPCTAQPALYDLALYPDTTTPQAHRARAVHQAAALCATCPTPCKTPVTPTTAPATPVLLDPDWMPPAREGRPTPTYTPPATRPTRDIILVGRDYVRPDQRVTAWARMAAEDAAAGRPLAEIATSLCVSESTAAALIRLHEQKQAAA